MEKMFKRLLSIAIVLAMVIAWLPGNLTQVFAATEGTPWNGGAITESGSYYLEDNVTLQSGHIEIPSGIDVTIDLCGFTITAQTGSRCFSINGNLTIRDSSQSQSGQVIGSSISEFGGTIRLNDGTLTLHSGTITGGTAPRGGNIYIGRGAFYMYGGTVSNGIADASNGVTSDGRGGNIFSWSDVHISGGTVTGGRAINGSSFGGNIMICDRGATLEISETAEITNGSAKNGGNIYLMYANINISGGTVSGGTATNAGSNLFTSGTASGGYSAVTISGGTICNGDSYLYGGTSTSETATYPDYRTVVNISGGALQGETYLKSIQSCTLAGTPVIENLRLADGVLVTPEALSEGASITVQTDAGCQAFSGTLANAESYVAYFHAYGADTVVAAVDGALAIAAICPCCNVPSPQLDWTAWTGSAITESGHYYLASNVTLSGAVDINAGLEVTIDLRGHTLTAATGSRCFTVSGKLNILDSGSGGQIKGSTVSNNGGTIYLNSGSVMKVYDGIITGGTAPRGGNIYIDKGTFYLYGGTVTGGKADGSAAETDNRGGNIFAVTGSTFYMFNGVVSNGNANRGGNIAATGKVYVYGGMITGGNANYGGGNIFATGNTAVVSISDEASITSGSASNGGNICLMYATINISGGTISNGSIYAMGTSGKYSNVYISGGTINADVTASGTLADGEAPLIVISGGTLSGTTTISTARKLAISGAPKIDNLILGSGVLISPSQMSRDADISVDADGIFTVPLTNPEEYKTYFKASDTGKTYTIQDNALMLYSILKEGTCGASLTYTLTSAGVLLISGTGNMYDFSSNGAPWYMNRSSITSVVIESGVTSIGNNAFYNCSTLTDITIPSTVTGISSSAFTNAALENVYYGGTQTQWDALNLSLSGVAIHCASEPGSSVSWTVNGSTLTISGSGAMANYYYDTTLTSYTGTPWKEYADQITSVVIESGVTSVGNWAFYGLNNLNSVTIPSSVTGIGANAFRGCTALATISIPNSVTKIGDNAFYGCTGLTAISGISNVTKIGAFAFYGCTGLTAFTVPAGVTQIGDYAFSGCTGLTAIHVDAGNTNYASEGGVLFNQDKTKLIQAPGGISGSYVIPDSVTVIQGAAFDSCASLQTVTLGTGVTTIGKNAFANCANLTGIEVAAANATYASENGALYTKDLTTLVQVPGGISSYAAQDSVTAIGDFAFAYNTKLTQIKLPVVATSVGKWAFSCNTNLTVVTIPTSVATVKTGAFEHTALETVRYRGTQEQWSQISVERDNAPLTAANLQYMYSNPVSIAIKTEPTKTEYYVGDTLDTTGMVLTVTYDNATTEDVENGYTVSPSELSTAGTQTVTVTYEEKTTTFQVTVLPGGVGEDGLAWTLINGTLTISGTGAMADYSSENPAPWQAYAEQITSVMIGAGITGVDTDAFAGCTVLTGFQVDAENATYCSDVSGVLFNKEQTTLVLAPDTISGSYVIPDTVATIGGNAFAGCAALTDITIPAAVTSIGIGAFSGCTGLENVHYNSSSVKWKQITVGEDNEALSAATKYYAILSGDVDGNGKITRNDAIYILWYIAGKANLPNEAAADFDGNGSVTRNDAIYILWYIAGKLAMD